MHAHITYTYNNIADCGEPPANREVKLNYSSTLYGSVLILSCDNEMPNLNNVMNSTDEQVLNVTCNSNGKWIPDPAEFTCPSSKILPPDIENGIVIAWPNDV